MSTMGNRIIRAIKLDPMLYEEVEADPKATGQAAGVVVLSSIAAGTAMLAPGAASLAVFLIGILSALLGWVIWAAVIYAAGTKILRTPGTSTSFKELLRTLGFASAPGIIRVFGIIPGLGFLVFLVSSVWMITATVIAVRQALDYSSTARALLVCIVGWLIQALIIWAILIVSSWGGMPQGTAA